MCVYITKQLLRCRQILSGEKSGFMLEGACLFLVYFLGMFVRTSHMPLAYLHLCTENICKQMLPDSLSLAHHPKLALFPKPVGSQAVLCNPAVLKPGHPVLGNGVGSHLRLCVRTTCLKYQTYDME